MHCWGHVCHTARHMRTVSIVCYAQVHAVTHECCFSCTTGELEDSMESFFLSETSKYLFLLQANTTDLPDYYVFTTEGHLLPPFPSSQNAAAPTSQSASWQYRLKSWCRFLPNFSGLWFPPTDHSLEGRVKDRAQISRTASHSLAGRASSAALQTCASLCTRLSHADIKDRQQLLQHALPLLPLAAQDAAVLR